MAVHLHWQDTSFPAGFDDEHPNQRRAQFATVAEALEQAAHDVAFDGATVTAIVNEKGKDVLDKKKLVARAHELIDEHHAPIAGALPEKEFAARVAAAKADAERRAV